MLQTHSDFSWMRNKDFYLGIIKTVEVRMLENEMSIEELCQSAGIAQQRLSHIFSGLIEDVTLLELDNLLCAIGAVPKRFSLA